MRIDTRLARMLHVLIHMHLLGGRETSETIALMLNTNPVVVRRTMGYLRNRGIVQSGGGKGGGWVLAKTLEEVTLFDVHAALSDTRIFTLGLSSDHPKCPVEKAVNTAISGALLRAQESFFHELSAITLADIATPFKQEHQRKSR